MILLDAYAARSCPVKTQNTFDPTVPQYPEGADADLQEVFAGVQGFKDEVLGRLATAEGACDLRGADDRAVRTLEAIESGVRVIIGPWLPLDTTGHRRGNPDALVRGQDRGDGRPGYHPVQVKKRKIIEARHPKQVFCWTTPLEQPVRAAQVALENHSIRTSREAELIQMAHYVRALQNLGLAADNDERIMAGIIGTDAHPHLGDGPGIVWTDLSHRFLRTFSRTSQTHWKWRSAIERYDHEFGFRVKVAETAASHVPGEAYTPRVQPIVVRECTSCPWWSTCQPALDADDLSLRIAKSPLDVREISVLRRLGISTLADLADADLDALLPQYLPECAHQPQAARRLKTAQLRSRMLRDGVALTRMADDPIVLPSGDIEVDLDIETSGDGQVYLWGLLVDDTTSESGPTYHAFARFHDMTTADQIDLAREAMAFIESLRATGREVRVYHYSDYEPVHLDRLAAQQDGPVDDDVLAREYGRVKDTWVDMYTTMKDHFFGVNGLGLKVVAREGAGFTWRDEEPGGLNSQTWFRDACDPALNPDTREAARQRVLDYNEDDVRATHVLRKWLREKHVA